MGFSWARAVLSMAGSPTSQKRTNHVARKLAPYWGQNGGATRGRWKFFDGEQRSLCTVALSPWGLQSGRGGTLWIRKKSGMRGRTYAHRLGLNHLPSPYFLKTLLPTTPQLPGKGTGRRQMRGSRALLCYPHQPRTQVPLSKTN